MTAIMFDRKGVEDLFERFLSTRRLSRNTVSAYRYDLKFLLDWCDAEGVSALQITTQELDLHFYNFGLTRSDATVHKNRNLLKHFYSWLATENRIPADPLAGQTYLTHKREMPDMLDADQLRRLLSVAKNDSLDFAACSLLAINALQCEDIERAQVRHLGEREHFNVLKLASRRGRTPISFTILAPETVAAIHSELGDRKHGSLLLNRDGQPLLRRSLSRIVKRVAREAELPTWVTPRTLTFAMRRLAMDHSFSYVSVTRCAGELAMHHLTTWLDTSTRPFGDHAAVRMADLLLEREQHQNLLYRSELLLADPENPPLVAVTLGGATLERELREAAMSVPGQQPPGRDNPTLSSWGGFLRRCGVLEETDVQLLAQLQNIRNDAAHGFFDRVDRERAQWFIEHARRLITRLGP